eukprot:CAMPEP_0195538730 /NCGR_PEP_ID=MMETSP0794_2-20130614/49688_1 /TAXON_ID=515487 /ORGANISM="Stephanopyxis turris, Strain CCMP 815" /LENGTH=543 /DNA_ID=CAMNT_0040672737 /DNA_START=15 /DNA_END=1643 /DNA_ORIENTATION=+
MTFETVICMLRKASTNAYVHVRFLGKNAADETGEVDTPFDSELHSPTSTMQFSQDHERKNFERSQETSQRAIHNEIYLPCKCLTCRITLNPGPSLPSKYRTKSNSLYSLHPHPLLLTPSCAVCSNKALAVEIEAMAMEKQAQDQANKGTEQREKDAVENMDICSCCSRNIVQADNDNNENNDDISTASSVVSTMYLCDSCPRSFCFQCILLAHQPHSPNDEKHENAIKDLLDGSNTWKCLKCDPPSGLAKLQDEVVNIQNAKYDDDNCNVIVDEAEMKGECDTEEQSEVEYEEKSTFNRDDAGIKPPRSIDQDDVSEGELETANLLQELTKYEDAIEECQTHLEDQHLKIQAGLIREEIAEKKGISANEIEDEVLEEMRLYKKRWDDHYTRLEEALPPIQELLELAGISLLSFYMDRERERPKRLKGKKKTLSESEPDRKPSSCLWSIINDNYEKEGLDKEEEMARKTADDALDKLDKQAGFSKGSFRGASGYAPQDPNVYDIDLFDNNSDANMDTMSIEDIQSLEGAIEMPSNRTNKAWVFG